MAVGRGLGWAVVAAAGATAFSVASYRVWVRRAVFDALGDESRAGIAFFYRRWDLVGGPSLWLRLALAVITPALFWALALARLAPRAAHRSPWRSVRWTRHRNGRRIGRGEGPGGSR